jgi:nucleoside-diphosphate-sugar epimerase
MRVAVTGASGFVGGWVARHLTEGGHDVYAFGRRAVEDAPTSLPNYRQWDIASGSIPLPRVDAVVHCAARVGQWGDSSAYHAVNVAGTRHVLAAFDSAGQFVYVSTSSVYGPGNHRNLTEDTSIGAGGLTAYARSKAEGERLVAASGHRAIILRPHIVYGPGDTTLLPRLIAARRRGILIVPGNGTNRVSVTHVRNLAHGVERALVSTDASGTFNIADDEAPTIDELLRSTFERLGMPTRILYLPRPLAMAAAVVSETAARLRGANTEPLLTRYVVASLADEHTLDVARARGSLGYHPRYRFRDAELR